MANACVYRFRYRGEEWTVKDFSTRPWWVRKILAPILFWRELRCTPACGYRGCAQPRIPAGCCRYRDSVSSGYFPLEVAQVDDDG